MSRTEAKPGRRPRAGKAPSATSVSGAVLTLAEAASYLRATESEVLTLLRDRKLPGQQVGNDWRLLKSAIDQWLGSPALPDASHFWQTHFGALRDDPHLDEIVNAAYGQRGRPLNGEP